MHATHPTRPMTILAGAAFAAVVWIGATPLVGSAQSMAPATKSLAQQLVERAQAAHPDATEIGISATTARGCRGIASTDKTDIGEACEADDVKPMHTGKASVAKEKDGYDISVLLRDSAGRLVGVLGVEFKLSAGQTNASVLAQAQQIAREMATSIPSKSKLLAK